MFHKIKYKLFLSYAVVILVLIILSSIAYGISRNIIKTNVTGSYLNSLTLVSQKVDSEIGDIFRLYDLIYNNSDIRNAINQSRLEVQPYPKHYQYVKIHHALEDLISTVFTDSKQFEVLLYTVPDQVAYFSWNENTPDTNALQQDITQFDWNGAAYRILTRESYNPQMRGAEYLYFYMPLVNNYSQAVDSYVVAGIKTDYLRSVYDAFPQAGSQVSLIGWDGQVVTGSGSGHLPMAHIPSQGSGVLSSRAERQEIINIYVSLQSVDWRLVQQVPTGVILRDLNRWSFWVILGMVLLTACLILLCAYLANRISSPINHLCEEMRQVESGNMQLHPTPLPNDEIGILGRQFYNMVEQIETLNRQKLEEEKQRHSLEIEALQAQINPHFMYNTINSIKMLLRFRRSDQATSALTALVDLLKNTVGRSEQTTSLEEEVRTLHSYVHIQQLRYCPYQFEVDLPESLRNYRMLKFILQPFVENSLFHGFDEIDEHVRITLRFAAREEEDLLEIVLVDNGKGMDMHKLQEVLETGSRGNRLSGIGIPNIVERVRLTYGEPYGIHFESKPGQGTTIVIHLPLLEGENHGPTGQSH